MSFPGFQLDVGALKKVKGADPETTYELLILGGGPAAMSAAVYAARKLLKLAIITKDFGGQVLETTEIENWLGYQNIDARKMAGNFEEHVKSFELPASTGLSVTKVEKKEDLFVVETDKGKTFKGKALIYATGKRHKNLNVPGEKEFTGKGIAYCATCDAPFYKNKNVVVVGGGNSAFTTALDLMKVEASLTMINFAKGWTGDETLQERIKAYPKARLVDNHKITAIEGGDRVQRVVAENRDTGEIMKFDAEGVFIEIGLLSNSRPVADLTRLNEQGEVWVDCSCRTTVPGLFAAGDVTTVPYKQIVVAAGEGAKAALAAYDYLVEAGMV